MSSDRKRDITSLQEELISTRKKVLQLNDELLSIDEGSNQVSEDEVRNIKVELETYKEKLALAQQRVWRQEIFKSAATKAKGWSSDLKNGDYVEDQTKKIDVLVQTKYVYDNENTPNKNDIGSQLLKAMMDDCASKLKTIMQHYDNIKGVISLPEEYRNNVVFYSDQNPDYKYYCICDIVDPVDALAIKHAFGTSSSNFGKDVADEYNVCSKLDLNSDLTYRITTEEDRIDRFNQLYGSPRRVTLMVSETRILHELLAVEIDLVLKESARTIQELSEPALKYIANNMVYSVLSHAELLLRYAYYGKSDEKDVIKEDGFFTPLYAVLSPPVVSEPAIELSSQMKYAVLLKDSPVNAMFTRSEGSGSFFISVPLDTLPIYFNLDDIAHKLSEKNKGKIMENPTVYPIYTPQYAEKAIKIANLINKELDKSNDPQKKKRKLEIQDCTIKVDPIHVISTDLAQPTPTIKLFLFDNAWYYINGRYKQRDGLDRKWSDFLREKPIDARGVRTPLDIHTANQIDYAAEYAVVDSQVPLMQPGTDEIEVTKEFFMNTDLGTIMLYEDKDPGYLGSFSLIPLKVLKQKYSTVSNPPKMKKGKRGAKSKAMDGDDDDDENNGEEEEQSEGDDYQGYGGEGEENADDADVNFENMIIEEGQPGENDMDVEIDEFGDIELTSDINNNNSRLTGSKRDRDDNMDDLNDQPSAKKQKFIEGRIKAYKKLNKERRKSKKSLGIERINNMTARLDL